jgi:hypothetical protein
VNDRLDDVLDAIGRRRLLSAPAQWPAIDLISFRDFGPNDAARLRAFIRAVQARTGQALVVVGGGYGCSRLTVTVFVESPETAQQVLEGLMQSEAFRQEAVEADFRVVIRNDPYTRVDLKNGVTEGATLRGPACILFLGANAADSERLGLDEEARAIDQALLKSQLRDRFRIEQQWAVRADDLPGCLMRHAPVVVHFSGHGTGSRELVLKAADGSEQPASPQYLTKLFCALKDGIRCVVLNACYSDKQARAIAGCIDCVIGMAREIGDESAVAFAASFYEAIGYGKSVGVAFDIACARVGVTDPDDVKAPQLHTRGDIDAGSVFLHA